MPVPRPCSRPGPGPSLNQSRVNAECHGTDSPRNYYRLGTVDGTATVIRAPVRVQPDCGDTSRAGKAWLASGALLDP
eukprot:357618-Rhodomonas_salina.1